MDRRDFIKKSVVSGIAASAATIGVFNINKALGFSQPYPAALPWDLVAVRGGEPGPMFEQAIASMGGMKQFVKKGQSVVLKPNIGWDTTVERAANTNPQLISTIIKHCFDAGAKSVYVFDHTCDNWTKCYSNSGIEKAANDAGAKVVGGNTENYYQNVTITGTKILKTAKVHELILQSDVFINVPVLKNHSSARLTICMKNLMGIVWDREYWHSNDLQQCIGEFAMYRKPDLNIVDAYAVMKRNGPRGVSAADIEVMKSLILSPDIVAADAAATKFFGKEPNEIKYIKVANDLKLGNMNLDQIRVNRIKAA
jgi:uncharacterized protein (DUF362 family)